MKETEQYLQEFSDKKIGVKPIFFNLKIAQEKESLRKLFDSSTIIRVADDYQEELLELFGINHPTEVYQPGFKESFEKYYADLQKETPLSDHGVWVYFPWNGVLSHILEEKDFQIVRTARNRNLIDQREQEKFHDATVGIAGLSVGSSVAFALTLQGGPKHIKLADMDRLALTNTNRVLMGVDHLGSLKVEMAAHKIYEINPYAEIELFPEGLNTENISLFCENLDLVIDEIDNLAIKYLLRTEAKKRKIAVVMGADNGDNAVVDVERYDLDPDLPFFHGRLGETSYDELSKLDKFGIGKTITKHIGAENVTIRTQESLLEMGKTIVSWPQLGGAALINGAAVAYCVRKILNGQSVEGNRALISLDEKLIPEYTSDEEIKKRNNASTAFKKIFGL
ncbi:MAG: ThiF family adenylyltransferase [Patescibacteria group bacterium]|nr:ThiF family adenylyltransferase [Patescibacteria group bacterium]